MGAEVRRRSRQALAGRAFSSVPGAAVCVLLLVCGVPGSAAAGEKAEKKHSYSIHEWGVFTVPRNAAWANADMKSEWAGMPKEFYGRLPGRQLPYRGPVRKPVIYLHADGPMSVKLSIRFANGLPAVWWPAAEVPNNAGRVAMAPATKGNLLVFCPWLVKRPQDRVRGPAGRTPRRISAPAGHWIEALRRVKASDVFCAGGWSRLGDGWDTERFIYYDGIMKPPAVPGVSRQGGFVTLDVPGNEVWQDLMLVERGEKGVSAAAGWGGWEKALADGAGRHLRVEMKPADEARLRAIEKELSERLVRAGLNADEAGALVEVWRKDLFGREGLTVFYRVPQATYDRWLPLEASPAPKKLVRVGLVVHSRLEPELGERVKKLIAQLGSTQFAAREAARRDLLEIGGAAFPLLRKHAGDRDAEIADSCRSILETLDVEPLLRPVAPKGNSLPAARRAEADK